MKNLLFFLLFLNLTFSQVKILTWNIENFGKSKTKETISFIANTIKDYDVIAIQEVVAGYGGAQAVAKLADALNRKGTKWDYVVSQPTTGNSYKKERYAFIWKTAKLKLIGKPWLEEKYTLEIDREPFYATFESNKKQLTLVNFHAITKKMQPETEIKYFQFLPSQYANLNLIFLGDFNCPQSHTVFNPLKKMGYKSIFQNQKTSLKKECFFGDCLASELDIIFYNSTKLGIISSEVIPFYLKFKDFKEAKSISDHLPVGATFVLH